MTAVSIVMAILLAFSWTISMLAAFLFGQSLAFTQQMKHRETLMNTVFERVEKVIGRFKHEEL